jgi:H+/Cl- antiporter ClcA
MSFYYQNITIGLIAFYGIIALLISGLISWIIYLISKHIFQKKLKIKFVFWGLTIALFLIFILLVLTDKPYLGGR